jgi:hypothetical protein
VVLEAQFLIVYDMGTGSPELWKKILAPGLSLTSVDALNGHLIIGSGSGVFRVDLIEARIHQYTDSAHQFRGLNIDSLAGTAYPIDTTQVIVNPVVNDVTITTLSTSPEDPLRGMPYPTWAVGTDGGPSAYHGDDQTIYDGAVTQTIISIDFNKNGDLVYNDNVTTELIYYNIVGSYQTAGFSQSYEHGFTGSGFTGLEIPDGDYDFLNMTNFGVAAAHETEGFILTVEKTGDPTNGMYAQITDEFNTGLMQGDIKGCWLSGSDATDISSSSDSVTNGDFATGDLTGWVDESAGTGTAVYDAGTDAAKLTRVDGSNNGILAQDMSLANSTLYVLKFDIEAGTTATSIQIREYNSSTGASSDTIENALAVSAGNTYFVTFTKSATTANDGLTFRVAAPDGGIVYIDNVTLYLADPDRSVNDNGLEAHGSITRDPVATGADLVGHSGFSASNYYKQPYNSDLDFGTDSFHVSFWFKSSDNGSTTGQILERGDRAGGFAGGGQISLELDGSTTAGAIEMNISDDNFSTADTLRTTQVYDDSTWHMGLYVKRTNASHELHIDGVLKTSASLSAAVGSLSNTSAINTIGIRGDESGLPFTTGSLALVRMAASAPTADQISTMYQFEKSMFFDGAKSLLRAAAVTAVGFDKTTSVVYVGTSAGVQGFKDGVEVYFSSDSVSPVALDAVSDYVLEVAA